MHYDIDKYYKRIPLSKIGKDTQDMTRFMIFHWKVDPVSEKDKDYIENWLLVLRLLGVVFTVFLAAAISQLIVH